MEIMQIVSFLKLIANLCLFIHNGGIETLQPPLKSGTHFFLLRKSFKRVQCSECFSLA